MPETSGEVTGVRTAETKLENETKEIKTDARQRKMITKTKQEALTQRLNKTQRKGYPGTQGMKYKPNYNHEQMADIHKTKT